MPLTFEEIENIGGRTLLGDWYPKAEISREVLRGFYDNGIPYEWARALDAVLKIPFSAWPVVLPHAPNLTHKRSRRASVQDTNMETHQRLAISGGGGRDRTDWGKALKAKKLTQNALAPKVGMSPALLSMCRNGTPIRRTYADKIAALIPWPADKAHWRGGFIED